MGYAGSDRAADMFAARLRGEAGKLPGSGYLAYIGSIAVPDLASTILIELPSYDDPEVVNTVKAALAMAGNPDRIGFAICLQDDDPARKAALEEMPCVRIRHYALRDAPGTCAARYEAGKLYDGEDFVLHTDSHMRFARFWDVALLDQWASCRNGRAILTGYSRNFEAALLARRVDDPVFTERTRVSGRLLTANVFSKREPSAMMRVGAKAFAGPSPRLGAFICANMLFCPGWIDVRMPVDPKLHFYGDEVGMCVRYWTSGFDIYQPGVEPVHHLYADERAKTEHYSDFLVRKGSGDMLTDEGITRRERERRRIEKLYRIYDRCDTDLTGFDLGTVRSIDEYEEFCGVDFRRMRIRNYGVRGLFGLPHDGPGDMDFHDWEADYGNGLGKPDGRPYSGEALDIKMRAEAADAFETFCRDSHWYPRAAFMAAIRAWMDEQKRGRYA